jgi:hypothetical protein
MDRPENESDAVEDVSRPVSRNTWVDRRLVGVGKKSDTAEKINKMLGTKGGVFQTSSSVHGTIGHGTFIFKLRQIMAWRNSWPA